MGKACSYPLIVALWAFCVASAIASPAQVFTTLVSFDGSNGYWPYGAVVQGRDGNLYGTTAGGYTNGTIYKATRQGELTVLHTYDLAAPLAALVLGSDGKLYGSTFDGGLNGQGGTIFDITQSGTLTTLYNFCANNFCPDGSEPQGQLIQAADGNFYGTTYQGGTRSCDIYNEYGCGTIFKITPSGSLTPLHIFQGTDGALPYDGLTEAIDGAIYGTTFAGGANTAGTIFRITPQGEFNILYSFDACQGPCLPNPNLLQTDDGTFYGTSSGGAHQAGAIFRLTPDGKFTTFHDFCDFPGCADGSSPYAGLVLGSDGNLYGMTTGFHFYNHCPMARGCGTIFRITPQGTLTVLHHFREEIVNAGALFQATDGKFYGTTTEGGQFYRGSVFSLDIGLSPFVRAVHNSGKAGSVQGILGQGFTGTTSVTFNGTQASFTVVSDTFLKATVPAGATTGYVEVTTPGGALKSDRKFRVTS